jgi:uncharacterized protein (TIGR03000 family)
VYGGGSSGSYASPVYGGSTGTAVQYGTYDSYTPESYSSPSMPSYEVPGSSMSMPMEGMIVPSASTSVTQSATKLAAKASVQPSEVHLSVKLPEQAKVYVNGNLTTSTGNVRHFVSHNLKEKEAYRFEVKAVLAKDDGTEVVQNKTVVVNSGKGEEIAFDMLKADDPIETILTLNVPEDAKVTLAQNSTKSEGTARVFRTKQLAEGQAWDDYTIEVTHKGETKQKTIRLIGGDKLELTFNFEENQSTNKVAIN